MQGVEVGILAKNSGCCVSAITEWGAGDMAFIGVLNKRGKKAYRTYTRLSSRGNFLRRLGGELHEALDSVDIVKPLLLGQISTDVSNRKKNTVSLCLGFFFFFWLILLIPKNLLPGFLVCYLLPILYQ